MTDTVAYEVGDGVATLTLNRPERLNTITPELARDVQTALAAANDDPEVHAMRLRGAPHTRAPGPPPRRRGGGGRVFRRGLRNGRGRGDEEGGRVRPAVGPHG